MKLWIAGFANFLWNEIITHIPWHGFRKFFLRAFNRNISGSSVFLMHIRILCFWKLIVGERTVINQFVLLDCRRSPVRIENDVDIGTYTRIWTTEHLTDDPSHDVSHSEVIILDHAWIASGVTVLPGIEIGRGTVIGAGSVVTKSTGASEIWAGSPAKFIRKRMNPLEYKLNYAPYFE